MSKRRSPVLDTRVVYCGDNLEQLAKLPDQCVDLIYIDPPFNSNRNYEVFWGETKEKRAFADRHASTAAYIDFMRPALRRTAPRAQADRQLLLPLRLARLALRQGDAGPGIRGEPVPERNHLEANQCHERAPRRNGRVHDIIFLLHQSAISTRSSTLTPACDQAYIDRLLHAHDTGRPAVATVRLDRRRCGAATAEEGDIDVRQWASLGDPASSAVIGAMSASTQMERML